MHITLIKVPPQFLADHCYKLLRILSLECIFNHSFCILLIQFILRYHNENENKFNIICILRIVLKIGPPPHGDSDIVDNT